MAIIRLIGEILRSVGVDSTIWAHLACFMVSYVFLYFLVFKPYLRALREREARTTGSEETTTRLIDETKELHVELERRMRAANAELRKSYDKARSEALHRQDEILQKARAESQAVLEQARNLIAGEIRSARQKLSAEVPVLASAVASKLVGKELS